MVVTRTALAFVTSVIPAITSAASASAQIAAPPVTQEGGETLTRPATASEYAFRIRVENAKLHSTVTMRQPTYPRDSIQAAVAVKAAVWLEQLQHTTVQGIQLDPYGSVAVTANHDAYATEQIRARLATPGLSFADRAYTYMIAAQSFTDEDHPQRLPTAEDYTTQLDAMGKGAVVWQYRAHVSLANVYYLLGRNDDMLRHAHRAVELVPMLSFFDRGEWFGDVGLYFSMVDILRTRSDGAAQIAALNKAMLECTKPTADLIARDSAFYWMGRGYEQGFRGMMQRAAMIGNPAPPIVSNHWLNTPWTGARDVSLADGKVRVVHFGGFGSAEIAALFSLQRLKDRFPSIDVMYVTATTGAWGNRLVTPEVEVSRLKESYVDTYHLRFPIALWAGEKQPAEDGGMLPEPSPTFRAYRGGGLFVIDAHGTIRRIFGGLDREQEIQIGRFLNRIIP